MYVKCHSFWCVLFQNGNSSNAYLLMIYFVRKQMYRSVVLQWTFSAINLLVLWRCSCSWSVKVCIESVSYICCFFWGPTEWSTADICCGMTGSMNLLSFLKNRRIMCCSFKTCADVMNWTDTPHCSFSVIDVRFYCFVPVAILLLGYQRHTQRISLLAIASNWKHVFSHDRSFLAKGFNRSVFRG